MVREGKVQRGVRICSFREREALPKLGRQGGPVRRTQTPEAQDTSRSVYVPALEAKVSQSTHPAPWQQQLPPLLQPTLGRTLRHARLSGGRK